MLRLFLMLSVFGLANLLRAQNSEPDSLKEVLKGLGTDRQRLEFFNHAAFLMREKNLQQSLEWSLEAERLAINLVDSVQLVAAKGNLGWIYYRLGVWDKSFRYSKDAYVIGSKIGYRKEVGMALNNLGDLYFQRRNYTEAIQKFKEALEVGIGIDDDFLIIRSMNNIALNLSKVGELDSAYWYAEQALKQNESIGAAYFNTFTHRVIGDILLAKGEVLQSIKTYERALEASSAQKLRSFEASVFHRLGKAHIIAGNNVKAKEYLEKGLIVSQEGGFKDELLQTFQELANLYHALGNVEKAYQYHRSFTELNKEQEEANDKERIAVLQAMFEMEKSDAEINFLKMENSVKELEIQNFKRLVVIVAIFVILALFLWIRMLVLNKRLKQAHHDLEKKRDFSENQRRELEAKSAELAESNRMKNRIFSILGHDLKTPVAQLKGVLELLHDQELTKEEFEGISHILKRNVDGLFETIDNILVWSKSQMEGFRVQPLPIKMIRAVRPCLELLQHQANSKDIIVYLYVDPDEEVFADPDLLQIIIRNLISNAIKFSNKGSRIDVMTKVEGDLLKLIVQDFGTGMSELKLDTILNQNVLLLESSAGTEKEKGTGLGLSLCKEFLSKMQGFLEIESKKGEGTRVAISLPRVTHQSVQPVKAQ
jgi:signal transduction histidine kinase/predicted negative regulator of RcsB-dependent stress response